MAQFHASVSTVYNYCNNCVDMARMRSGRAVIDLTVHKYNYKYIYKCCYWCLHSWRKALFPSSQFGLDEVTVTRSHARQLSDARD